MGIHIYINVNIINSNKIYPFTKVFRILLNIDITS